MLMDSVARKFRQGAAGTACLCSVMSRSSARRPKGWSDSVKRDWDGELVYSQAWAWAGMPQRLGSAGTLNSISVPVVWPSCQHVCLWTFGLLTWLRALEWAFQQMLPFTPSLTSAPLCWLKQSQICPDRRRGDRDRPHLLVCQKNSGPCFRTATGTHWL